MREQLDLIVKEIVEGAQDGLLPTTFGGIHVQFSTNIEGKVIFQSDSAYTLTIDHYTSFLDSLESYITTLIESHHKWLDVPSKIATNTITRDAIRDYVSCLFLYMTPWDFQHPKEFVDRYREFLKDQTWVEPQEYEFSSFDCKLQIHREEQDYGQETPYALIPTLVKEINGQTCKYVLPYLRYGMTHDNGETQCYLYAIQDHKQVFSSPEEEKFQKKIRRKLYQLSAGLPEEYADTVNSFAFSENVLLAELEKMGVSQLIVAKSQPLKLMVKENVFAKQQIPEGMSKSKLQAMGYVFDVNRIIENVTTKFLLTAKRCSEQNQNYDYIDVNEGYVILNNRYLEQEIDNDCIRDIHNTITENHEKQHR